MKKKEVAAAIRRSVGSLVIVASTEPTVRTISPKTVLSGYVCKSCGLPFSVNAGEHNQHGIDEPFCATCGSTDVEPTGDDETLFDDGAEYSSVVCSCGTTSVIPDAALASLGGAIRCVACGESIHFAVQAADESDDTEPLDGDNELDVDEDNENDADDAGSEEVESGVDSDEDEDEDEDEVSAFVRASSRVVKAAEADPADESPKPTPEPDSAAGEPADVSPKATPQPGSIDTPSADGKVTASEDKARLLRRKQARAKLARKVKADLDGVGDDDIEEDEDLEVDAGKEPLVDNDDLDNFNHEDLEVEEANPEFDVTVDDDYEYPLTEGINDEGDLDLSLSNDAMLAFVDGTCVASLSYADAGENQDVFHQRAFAGSILHAARKEGITAALHQFNFVPATVKVPVRKLIESEVTARLGKRESQLASQEQALAQDYEQSLMIAAAALNKNFYKGHVNPIQTALLAALTPMGVSAKLVKNVLASAGAAHVKELFALAKEIKAKPLDVRNEIAATLDDVNNLPDPDVDGDEDENDEDHEIESSVTARLSGAGLRPVTASLKQKSASGSSVAGLASSIRQTNGRLF